MKPILSVKVQRGNGDDPEKTLNVWEKSEHHLTLDGLREFEQRQRDRLKTAQQRREQEAKQKVRKIDDARQAAIRG